MRRPIFVALLFVSLCISIAQAAVPKAEVTAVLSQPSLLPGERAVIAVTVDVPAGFHTQSHTPLEENLIPLKVTITPSANYTADAPIYPEPKIENYPLLGKVSVYTGKTVIFVPITASPAATGSFKIEGGVSYQMCDDKQCFMPQRKPFASDATVQAAWISRGSNGHDNPAFTGFDWNLLKVPGATQSATAPAAGNQPPVATSSTESSLAPTSLIGALALALGVGVIFNVMPCVLPVLPLKAVGFYEAAEHDRSKTIVFGLLFSAGMVAMFAALACVLLLSKSILGHQFQWGQQFAYPWFVWTMAAIIGLLGLGMLGVFAVRLPTSVYGFNFRHDTLVGNFLWGGLTAILSTPCTAPLFPPLLAWAIGQPLASGFMVIIAVGVGMALPYLILSAFPQLARKFPRTGPFAELFKQMMGFLLLGTAAWFAGIRLLADPNQWWLVFAVVVIAAVFLILRTRQILPSPRALSIACMLAVVLVGIGLMGAIRLTTVPFKWQPFTPDSFAAAKAGDQIVLVEFTASWCLNCKYIEQTVYHDPRTLDELRDRKVITLKADLTDYSAPGWTLLNQLGGTGIPFTAIYPPASNKPLTLESIYTADTLMTTLDQARRSAVAAGLPTSVEKDRP